MSMVGGAVGHAIGHAASAATHKRASQHAAAATEAEEHDGGGGELFVIAHPSGCFFRFIILKSSQTSAIWPSSSAAQVAPPLLSS